MRVCLMIEGQEGVTWEQWLALARACEEAELEALFRSDHYGSLGGRPGLGALDAWATVNALAARTERIRLGTLVSPVTFRHAAVVAKNAATAAEISGGRVEVGIGAGWHEGEHRAYGLPFPPRRERLDELERHAETIVRHWTEAEEVWPKPSPRPNLIVGGSATPRTVSVAVRFADEYNTTFADAAACRERRRAVDEACARAGRDPLTFSLMTGAVLGASQSDLRERVRRFEDGGRRDASSPALVVGTLDEAAERLRSLEDAGVERVMLQHIVHEDVEMVALLGELARAVA